MSQGPQPELFVDGLLDVSFARGIVRVDLYSLSATDKLSNGQPRPEQRQRLVMSAQSFVDFVAALQLATQSLREKGALSLPGAPAAAQPAQPEAAPAPTPAPVSAAAIELPSGKRVARSPNFAAPKAAPMPSVTSVADEEPAR